MRLLDSIHLKIKAYLISAQLKRELRAWVYHGQPKLVGGDLLLLVLGAVAFVALVLVRRKWRHAAPTARVRRSTHASSRD
jgi:hypothetical protein